MSFKPVKRDNHGWTYHIENIPSHSQRPAISRSGSSSTRLPSLARAVVRKRADESPHIGGRFNFVSNSPETGSSRSSSVVDVSTPEVPIQRNGSIENMKQHRRHTPQSEDEEIGSMILVRKAEYVIKAMKPIGQYAKRESEALSADEHVDDHDHVREPPITKEIKRKGKEEQREDSQNQRHRSSDSALNGLMGAMKLESQMILLRRELQLYQVFSDTSSDIFIQSMHDQFIDSINSKVRTTSEIARPLEGWSQNCGSDDIARYLDDHLNTAKMVSEIWKPFYGWIMDIFDGFIRHQREVEQLRVSLQQRRKKSMTTVIKLLWLLGDVEMVEGMKGVRSLQNGLQRQWKNDRQVRRKKTERLGAV